jgi:hypothetical protein
MVGYLVANPLLKLIDIVEQTDADRLQHLIQLSQLRNIPLTELMQQLDILSSTSPCLDDTSLRQRSVKIIERANRLCEYCRSSMAGLHPPIDK